MFWYDIMFLVKRQIKYNEERKKAEEEESAKQQEEMDSYRNDYRTPDFSNGKMPNIPGMPNMPSMDSITNGFTSGGFPHL